MTSFFERISQEPKKLTPSERKLVKYLLTNYPNGILDSASSIARQLVISPSTVVRFFSKIGYDDFASAQREVRLEISAKLASPFQRASATLPFDTSPSKKLIDEILEADIRNLKATRNTLDLKSVEQAVKLLVSSAEKKRNILLVGEKNSFGVAQYLRTQLNMCLPNVFLLDSRQSMVADDLIRTTKSDVLLAISIRRYSTTTIRVAEHFNSMGATVIGIIDSPTSPLAKLSNLKIYVQTSSPYAFDSYTSVFYICNVLLSMVANAKKVELHNTLKRGEDLWQRFQTFQQGMDT